MCILSLLLLFQTGFWESIPALPTSRQEVGVAAVEGRVYVVGGLDASGFGRTTVEIFNTAAGQWETGPPLPVSLHHPNVAAVGAKVYVAGGYAGPTGTPAAITLELDVDRLEWTRKADMPTARGAGAVAAYNGRLYVFGGERGITVNDAAVFDPVTNSWSTLAPMPTARNHMGAAVVRGKIYIIGGRPGNQSVNEAYDPLTNTWISKAPMPTGRSGHAVTSANDFIFAFGGEGNPAASAGTFAQTESYNPDLNSWTALAPMPAARHGIGAAVIGNRIFLPGGGSVQGLGPTSYSDYFAVQQDVLIPQFVVGGGYSTSITVTNPEQSRAADVTLSLAGIDGGPLETNLNGTRLSTMTFSVPALASRTVAASEPAALKVGTARISANVRITAYALIQGVGNPLTVYPATPARHVIFDARRFWAAGVSTGVALANLSGQPATVTLSLRSDTGLEAARVERVLTAGEHLSRFIHQFFPELVQSDFTGAVTVRSTEPIAVAALAFDPSGVVTIPVVPVD